MQQGRLPAVEKTQLLASNIFRDLTSCEVFFVINNNHIVEVNVMVKKEPATKDQLKVIEYHPRQVVFYHFHGTRSNVGAIFVRKFHKIQKGVIKMKTGALYIRVSTDDQTEYSPDAQIRMGLEYAKKNNIIVPKKFIYQDDGISGRKAINRPAFQELIATAKSEEHPFDVILVWKFSRFARNQEEAIVYKNLLKKADVDVVSVSEPIPDGFIGELVQRIFEWMDEYYSINLSGEVMRGMTERASRGGYNSAPPLGYRMQDGIPVIVPETAAIVKKIFDWYVNDNMSFFDIAKRLNTLGYKTKRGGNFQNRTVAYIIRNEFYIGKIVWNKLEHSTRKVKDKSEWIIAEGEHEHLISDELFKAAQEKDAQSIKPRKARPTSTYKHWLSGLLVCSACGGRLVRAGKSKTGNTYFQCTAYNHASCTESHLTNENALKPAILDSLKKVLDSGTVEYTVHTTNTEDKTEKKLLETKLNRIALKEERIKEAYRDGIDTLEEYKNNKEILLKEKNELLTLLEQYSTDDSAEKDYAMLNKIRSAYDIINSDSTDLQKHDALASIVEKIVYDKKNQQLLMYFYISE